MTSRITRRAFLLSGGASIALSACSNTAGFTTQAPGLAITIDDFRHKDGPVLSFEKKDAAIRTALKAHGLQAGAFPIGQLAGDPRVDVALGSWAEGGHVIGNHSFTHPYYGGKDSTGMMADVLRAEAALSSYPTYRKWLRFPYLAEGRTARGRDAMRTLMSEHGYRNAHVTIDTSDWYIDMRLNKRLSQNPDADFAPYRDYYLKHLWDRATYYNSLALNLTGRADISHTILLHHNLVSALFLSDALVMFKDRGWRLMNIDAAYTDSVYELLPDSVPAGQSLIWAMANSDDQYSDQLRYPGEGKRYEVSKMDAAGL